MPSCRIVFLWYYGKKHIRMKNEKILFTKPIVQEILLQASEKHSLFQPIEGSNEILLSERIIQTIFKEVPIIKIILPNDDLLPQSCLTFSFQGHGPRWHRDRPYPIVGIYKPFQIVRKAGTLFTVIDNLTVFNQRTFRDIEYYRNDYSNASISSLTLFSNKQFSDGRFMVHKRETFPQNETATMMLDAGKAFFIKVQNVENNIEGDE